MHSIKLRARAGKDGILHLNVPVGLIEQEIEVIIVFQALESVKTPEALGWQPGFFEQTAGCLQDDPILRYPQGEYEVREPLL
ncbi:MAG: hypothetical protein SVX43_23775 [Cyanobacteriota bacterium]|nr:hypothetical protein [Cyanobacteriota bacterium]